MRFADTASGTPSAHSKHPRSELRELDDRGNKAAWISAGHHELTCRARIHKADSRRVVIGQIYNHSDGIPLLELSYVPENKEGGNFSVLYEEERGKGKSTPLALPMNPDEPFCFTLAVEEGTLKVSLNEKEMYSKDIGVGGKTFYFKCGNYDQESVKGPLSGEILSEVDFEKIEVKHKSREKI